MKDKKGHEAALYEYYNIANKNVAELCNHQKAVGVGAGARGRG